MSLGGEEQRGEQATEGKRASWQSRITKLICEAYRDGVKMYGD